MEVTQDIVKETAKLPELLHKTTALCHISLETATDRHQVSAASSLNGPLVF